MPADLREKLIEMLCERLVVPKESLVETASFIDDLGCGSLDMVDLALAIEESFGISIPDADYTQLATVGAALSYVSSRVERHDSV